MQWKEFGEWMKQRDAIKEQEIYVGLINDCLRGTSEKAFLQSSFSALFEKIPKLQELFSTFKQEACKHSQLFQFWNLYVESVFLLLRLIRAERDGSWELHLSSVTEMIPYFCAMDRVNYSR